MNKPTLQFILFLTLVIGLGFVGKAIGLDLSAIRDWLLHSPLWLSGLIYVSFYVGVTTFFWFGTLDFFRISGALLFGPYLSTLFVTIAEICNAAILFQLSRVLGRQWVEQTFRLKPADTRSVNDNSGFWTALALRVNPLIPFRFMDVGFGLSKLTLPKYMWAVVLGSPLRIFWLQFIIAGLGEGVFKNPQAMVDYLQTNRVAMQISGIYFLSVVVVSLGAVGVNLLKRLTRKPSGSDLR